MPSGLEIFGNVRGGPVELSKEHGSGDQCYGGTGVLAVQHTMGVVALKLAAADRTRLGCQEQATSWTWPFGFRRQTVKCVLGEHVEPRTDGPSAGSGPTYLNYN